MTKGNGLKRRRRWHLTGSHDLGKLVSLWRNHTRSRYSLVIYTTEISEQTSDSKQKLISYIKVLLNIYPVNSGADRESWLLTMGLKGDSAKMHEAALRKNCPVQLGSVLPRGLFDSFPLNGLFRIELDHLLR